MIIKDKNIIFIHIPKTAGTSVEEVFCRTSGGMHIPFRHRTLSDIVNENDVDKNDYFKFTIIRNIFDRILSTYYHRLGILHDDLSFHSYLELIKKYLDGNLEHTSIGTKIYKDDINAQSKHHYFDIRHINKMNYWFDDSELDYIIRYENINEDWEEIKKRFSVGDLPRTNWNPVKDYRKPYKDYYSKQDIDLVYDIYSDEIEKYDQSI